MDTCCCIAIPPSNSRDLSYSTETIFKIYHMGPLFMAFSLSNILTWYLIIFSSLPYLRFNLSLFSAPGSNFLAHITCLNREPPLAQSAKPTKHCSQDLRNWPLFTLILYMPAIPEA